MDRHFVQRPDQYLDEQSLLLDSEAFRNGGSKTWARFLASTTIAATRVDFRASTPQIVLDSLANQPQLEALGVKHGSYSDLSPLAGLKNLTALELGGATKVTSIAPLGSLSALRDLHVSQAFQVDDLTALSSLTALKNLIYGNASLGSDRSVDIPSMDWVRSMISLEVLRLPGTRILEPDLSALLQLSKLRLLGLPLRRSYREQVFRFGDRNQAFAMLAESYRAYEAK